MAAGMQNEKSVDRRVQLKRKIRSRPFLKNCDNRWMDGFILSSSSHDVGENKPILVEEGSYDKTYPGCVTKQIIPSGEGAMNETVVLMLDTCPKVDNIGIMQSSADNETKATEVRIVKKRSRKKQTSKIYGSICPCKYAWASTLLSSRRSKVSPQLTQFT
jgi:hypothetical protein